MKLAGYLRVSTVIQAEKGLGLDVQKETIKAWAKEQGHKIVSWHTDGGVSGSNGLESRQALPEALEALQAGQAQGLVVYRLDRLARDLMLQEQLLAELKRMGAAVYSTAAGEDAYLADDPSDPSRKMIRQMLGAVSEYEKAMVVVRLKAGRKRKHETGGYAYGRPGLGYKAEGGKLVADESEQETLQLILRLHAEGLSTRQIAERLNESEHHSPKRADQFYSSTISRIIRRHT